MLVVTTSTAGRGKAAPHDRVEDAAQRRERGVIDQLRRVATDGARHVPLPASGATAQRFAVLAAFAEDDLALGRLVEGHLDALAILSEAGMEPAHPEATYGVWAARSRHRRTLARLEKDGWHLSGEKAFCSGSVQLDRALVTAETPDGYRLFDVSVPLSVTEARAGSWPAVGMAESLSETLVFGGPPLSERCAIGPPGFYLQRPGFWFGATGVAACWSGGARGLVTRTVAAMEATSSEGQLAELGHTIAHVDAIRGLLEWAGGEIDGDPSDSGSGARHRAMVTRHAVHHAAQQVLGHVAAAGGAGPLCHDGSQARRAADLQVYLAQYHGPQDATVLGRFAVGGEP